MLKKSMFLAAIFVALSCVVEAQAQEVYGDYAALEIKDGVQWIDETISPDMYIGQVFLVKKDNSSEPYLFPVSIKAIAQDDVSIKKSILIASGADGNVSFANVFSLSGQREKVFQFQVVNSKRWVVDMKSPDYMKAIADFRANPMTSPIFDSQDYAGIVMVVGVVERKIWYKKYSKQSFIGGGTYVVKVGGNSYSSSDEYEELIKYGLVIRPISGFGFSLPKIVVNTKQVTDITEKAVISEPATHGILNSVRSLIANPM